MSYNETLMDYVEIARMLKTENIRLREALKEIAENECWEPDSHREIARAALVKTKLC